MVAGGKNAWEAILDERHRRAPSWDDQEASEPVGARVLIGVTHVRADGVEQEQMFGVIKSADARGGFEVALEGSRSGESYWLPNSDWQT